jgi:serine/threonine-protein kinase
MSADAQSDSLVGTTVAGKYRVDELLGRGGMGAVYRATNVAIGKRVALKFLDRDAARDVAAVARFQREAEAASAIESEHIVHIFDTGIAADGLPFLVLELLHGEDLRARLRREGRLGSADAVLIAAQTLRGLSRAHDAGIVHRDLKPENVFLCKRDDDAPFVKLVDFGISKVAKKNATVDTLTRQGMVLGTAYYMSPEQAQAFPDVDGRSDLYGLGAMLYEALTGGPPHTGTVYEAVLVSICTKDADDVRVHAPEVSEALAAVVKTALARDRAFRYQTANEFLEALRAACPELAIAAIGGKPARAAAATGDSSLATMRGTAVQTPAVQGKRRLTRTVVAMLVSALAAFAATTWLAGRRGSQVTGAAPARSASAAPATAAAAAPVPADAPRAVPSANAQGSSSAAEVPSAPPLRKPRRTAPTTSARAVQPGAATNDARPGVASGLKLKTLDP